ncbi:MAG: FtsK/SpoIIIE domain-containing protein [Nocardioides sp.]
MGEVVPAITRALGQGLCEGAGGDRTPVVSLSERRHRTLSQSAGHRSLFLDGAAVDPAATLAESGLKEGSLLTLADRFGSLLGEPDGLVEVRMVTGPGAGTVHRLPAGAATIGSDASCVVAIADPRVPPVAALVTVKHDSSVEVSAFDCATVNAASTLAETVPHIAEALALDRAPVGTDPVGWPVGSQLTIGDVRLELERTEQADAAVDDSAEPGWLDYNRPPRLLPPERLTHFRLPAAPPTQRRNAIPWLVTLAPLALSLVMVWVTDSWRYLVFGLMSPLMMLGNYFQTKKAGQQDYRRALADYREKKRNVEADIEQAVIDERSERRQEAPDPALSLLIATGPRGRLWERRVTDPDYLRIRLGVGDLPSDVTVDDPSQPEHRRRTTRTAYDVPVTISLRERGVIGVAATDGVQRRLGSWAIAQLGVLQSPRDTQVYVLTDQGGLADWDWLRWLPHARPQAGQDTVATLGGDAETCARRIAELSAMLAARQQARAAREDDTRFPDVVVVFDGARRLRMLPGAVAVLKQGPAVGIYSICLDSDERLLPEEAAAVVVRSRQGVSLRQQRLTIVDRIVPDLVDQPWLNRVARAVAPIRDISDAESDSVLPTACRLTDILSLEPVHAEAIKARWAVSPRSTTATIGISLDGPFGIDLRRDGPHGLVAGTTGAGKSELLQSLVAALAVANRPDGMTFVLVDYKGGAAFKDCVDLPHTVGMVTDLDAHLVERALVSLGAELTRREHLLAAADAKDIEDYLDIADKRREPNPLAALPRLVIVIDEFASMARELPDFVTGLVNVAQRGRSLGIHLILATQRPGGVVSPEIRANTNLRIALRVTDAAESTDVIDSPVAATISKAHPGRAYVRLGANSLVPFQSGRVGGRRPGATTAAPALPWVQPLAISALPQPIPRRPRTELAGDAELTDLKTLVRAIGQAANECGLAAQPSPWLPALSTRVLLADLIDNRPAPAYPVVPRLPYGLEDLPSEQAQRTAAVDFATFSHLAIVGGPRSGRSQCLRTLAGSVARLASPADVHLYAVDCGNGALLPLVDLPHCGAVVQRTQTDRVLRMLARLRQEMARRQEMLGQGGFADLGELRASTVPDLAAWPDAGSSGQGGESGQERVPYILLLVDRWEGFMGTLSEVNGGSPYEDVQTLLREGASVGIHLVLAGDRSVVNSRLNSLIEDKVALRVPEKSDYGLIGLHPRNLPDEVPDGRGFRAESGTELQFAVLDADTSGPAQAAVLRRWGAQARAEYAAGANARDRLPFRVDVLPTRVTFEQAWDLRRDQELRPLWAMLGVGGDELAAQGIDLSYTNAAIVAGPPKSGRSTALMTVCESLLRGGTQLVIAAPRPSGLRALANRDGVRGVLTDLAWDEATLRPLMEPGRGPVVLVIDDGELLKEVPAKDYLRSLVRGGGDHGQAVVLGGDSGEVASGFTGWQLDLKGRSGMLIHPQGVTDGDLIGVRLPRSATGGGAPVGRGLANVNGALMSLQVPG